MLEAVSRSLASLKVGDEFGRPAILQVTLAALAASTVAAMIFAAQNWIIGGPYGRLVWPRNVSVAFVQWWTWAVLTPPLVALALHSPLEARRAAPWLWWTLAWAVVFVVHLGLVAGIERLLDRVTPGEPLELTLANLLRKRAAIDLVTISALTLLAHMAVLQAAWKRELSARRTARVERTPEPALLGVSKNDCVIFVSPRDVRWVEAAGNYAILHVGEDEHMIRTPLKELSTSLGADFVQCNRSALVNLRAVAAMKNRTRNGDVTLVLRCGRELRLTRNFRRDVLEQIPR